MCGRYNLYHSKDKLEEFFQVSLPEEFAARYNIAPTQPVLIVRENPHLDAQSEAAHVVWGLIPPWAEDPRIGSKMINARCETASEKVSYKHCLKRRRCVVPVSGFYEWQARVGGAKQPYLIRARSGDPLGLAGLWDVWHGPNGELIESCTILTMRAAPELRELHDRMPVIVPRERMPEWLDRRNEDVRTLAPFFVDDEARGLEVSPVSRLVNNVRNDGPELLEPAELF